MKGHIGIIDEEGWNTFDTIEFNVNIRNGRGKTKKNIDGLFEEQCQCTRL